MGSVVLSGATSGATTITPTDAVTVSLTLPSTTGTLGLASGSATQSINAQNTFGFKNRIINGGMVIDQRNAGASGTVTNVFTVDRWKFYGSQSSKLTWGQNLNSITPPSGYTNYLGIQSSSAYTVTASDYFEFYQAIEGFNLTDLAWGTANAKSVTLSFLVYSSLTGTFGGSIQNNGQSRSYPFTYTISTANTWTSISVTITGETSGTWLTTNGAGLLLWLGFGVGSTFSGTAGSWSSGNYISATGATSVVGTSGATFYVTGVQLEVGTQATSFDFRDYGRELILCQRYYQKTYDYGIVAGTAGSSTPSANNGALNYVVPATSTYNTLLYTFKTYMRAVPTTTVYANYTGASGYFSVSGGANISISNAGYDGMSSSGYYTTSSVSGTNQITAHMTASAEL